MLSYYKWYIRYKKNVPKERVALFHPPNLKKKSIYYLFQ